MLINLDLSGAEWAIVAHLCRDPRMLEVVKSGKSPHLITGTIMSGLSEELVLAEHKLIGDESNADTIMAKRKEALPEVFKAKFLPRTFSIRQTAKKCLVGNTEVLTPLGWVQIRHVKKGQMIAQWDAGEISFVPVSHAHRYKNSDELIALSNRRFSQIVTSNHKMLVRGTKDHIASTCAAENFPDDTKVCVPISGTYRSMEASSLTESEIRFLAAVQADGSINPYGQIIFKLHKTRKIARLQKLFDDLKIKIVAKSDKTIHIPRCVVTSRVVKLLSEFEYVRQKRHAEKTLRHGNLSKNFGPFLLKLGAKEMAAFVDELRFWDGHTIKAKDTESFQYFTTVEENANWVQTIAHLVGHRATITKRMPSNGISKKPLFWVRVGHVDNTNTSTIKRSSATASEVFCVTVPSGFFMIRHNGKPSISGNSNHGLNYRESFRMFALANEMEEREAKQIVNMYSKQVYPGIGEWWNRIDEEVRRTRVLTNSFGRKCYFMGQLNDDTFKQATAFVPQSTVFDVTAQALPKLFEDASDDFAPAELLAQVHDSLLLQYRKLDFLAMARFVVKLALDYFSPTINYGEPFKLGVDCKVGLDWGSMKGLKLTPDADALARDLAQAWDEFHPPK